MDYMKEFQKYLKPEFKILSPIEIFGQIYDVEYVFGNKKYLQNLPKKWPKIKAKLEQLMDIENAPDKKLLTIMIKDFTNRREIKFQEQLNSKKFAERIAFIMPNETYDEINQKALNNDSDALLTLGDVFMYGLMRQVPDKQKALDYYKKAASLNQPEAMTALAMHYKFKVYQEWFTEQAYEYSMDTSFTMDMREYSDQGDVYVEFWRMLESAAALNWITPFLLKEARDCIELKTYTISNHLIEIVSKQGEIDSQNKASHSIRCSNPVCTFVSNNEKNLIKCLRCNDAKYCTRPCQVAHWQIHKDSCIPNERSETSSSISSGSNVTSKIVELDLIDHRTNEKVKMITNKPNNQLKEIQNKFNQITIDRDTTSVISTDPNQQDYYTRQMFANIRLRNVPVEQTIDELIRAADRSIQLNRYRAAAYSLTLAIDRIQIENPTFNIKKEERIKLSRIVKQRASCYVKYAEEEQSIQVIKMALVDCAFILETGVFKLNELPRDVKREISYIKDKALALESFLNLRQMRRDARQMRRAERISEQINTRPNGRRREQQSNGQATSCVSIDVFLCNQMHELDDLFTDHLCPICQNPWKNFFDPSFAVKFSCKHAFCATCIAGQFEVAKLEHSCGLCRAPVSEFLKQVSFINFNINSHTHYTHYQNLNFFSQKQ
jgi:hypothetical protein